MHSPPMEWTLAIGHLVVLDVLRARGEADRDTLSEVVRDVVERTPYGRTLFGAAVAAGGLVLHRHICR